MSAGAYSSWTYCLTIRRALNRGSDGPDGFPDDLESALRDAMLITVVEHRDHLRFEELIEGVRIGIVRRARVLAGAVDQPSIPSGVALGPPSITNTQNGTPLAKAFIPLVPLDFSGFFGVFNQTSQPWTMKWATCRS